MLRAETARPTDDEQIVELQLGTSAGTEAAVVLIALLPWHDALRAQCQLYGWDDRHLAAELLYGASEVRRVMEAYTDDGATRDQLRMAGAPQEDLNQLEGP